MTSAFVNPSWMPHSVGEAARAGDATADDLLSGRAWSHLLDGLRRASEVVLADDVPRNAADMAAGFRHLLVLLGIGLDNALREESGSVLAVKPSSVDAIYKWGMDCPDCIYTGAGLRGGETYRLWGNRGTARYVGLQAMAGMASSANVLLDELDLGPDGEVDLILSADPHEGNWLPIAENATALVVRHFFYDWDTEVASSLSIERIGAAGERAARAPEDPRAVVARQLIALGDFVVANLEFFLQFSRPETPNTFLPPLDGTAMGAAAENRPVIGSWELAPDEALLVEVSPPQGLYWSYSLGNPWWETIDYGAHQSSLNGSPGRRGRRRHTARGDRPRGSRDRQLARHGRAQCRPRHFALRPHRDGSCAHDAADQVLRCRLVAAGGSPPGDAGRTAGHVGRTPPRREQAVLPMTPGDRRDGTGRKEADRHGSGLR